MKVATYRDIDFWAEEYVMNLPEDMLPLKENDLNEEDITEFLESQEYEVPEELKNDFINCIIGCSEDIYNQIIEDDARDFRESLDKAIDSASYRLSDEKKLKIILSTICYHFD